jgi:hypothetical protein
VSGVNGAINGTNATSALSDWEAVRAASDIQYAPVQPKPVPPPPDWLVAFGRFLRRMLEPLGELIGLSWPVLEKLLIGVAILAALAIGWRLLRPLLRARPSRPIEISLWAPDRGEVLALLEDADRLAAEGKFDRATHLLLQRSVGQIATARPDWLHPASTAREIARLPGLPAKARDAFALIAERVERSLFALRSLDAADWQAARAAYAEFALQGLRDGQAA